MKLTVVLLLCLLLFSVGKCLCFSGCFSYAFFRLKVLWLTLCQFNTSLEMEVRLTACKHSHSHLSPLLSLPSPSALPCPLCSILFLRALCRTKLLPVTHVLVDTWMLTVKPVYKLSNVSDDQKWTTNTHVTPFILTFKA